MSITSSFFSSVECSAVYVHRGKKLKLKRQSKIHIKQIESKVRGKKQEKKFTFEINEKKVIRYGTNTQNGHIKCSYVQLVRKHTTSQDEVMQSGGEWKRNELKQCKRKTGKNCICMLFPSLFHSCLPPERQIGRNQKEGSEGETTMEKRKRIRWEYNIGLNANVQNAKRLCSFFRSLSRSSRFRKKSAFHVYVRIFHIKFSKSVLSQFKTSLFSSIHISKECGECGRVKE